MEVVMEKENLEEMSKIWRLKCKMKGKLPETVANQVLRVLSQVLILLPHSCQAVSPCSPSPPPTVPHPFPMSKMKALSISPATALSDKKRESVLQQLLESPQPVRETRTVLNVDREKVGRIVSSWC